MYLWLPFGAFAGFVNIACTIGKILAGNAVERPVKIAGVTAPYGMAKGRPGVPNGRLGAPGIVKSIIGDAPNFLFGFVASQPYIKQASCRGSYREINK